MCRCAGQYFKITAIVLSIVVSTLHWNESVAELSPESTNHVRVVSEWIVFSSEVSDSVLGPMQANQMSLISTGTAAERLAELESQLRIMKRAYLRSAERLNAITPRFKSSPVLAAGRAMNDFILNTEKGLNRLISIMAEIGGDGYRFLARQSELEEALAGLSAGSDVPKRILDEQTGAVLESALVLLDEMR